MVKMDSISAQVERWHKVTLERLSEVSSWSSTSCQVWLNYLDNATEPGTSHEADRAEELYALDYPYYSGFLVSYGLMERRLDDLCAILKVFRNLELSVHDLKHSGWERALDFMARAIGISGLARQERNSATAYRQLHHYRWLRNRLTHHQGQFDAIPQEVLRWVTKDSIPVKVLSSNLQKDDPFDIDAFTARYSDSEQLLRKNPRQSGELLVSDDLTIPFERLASQVVADVVNKVLGHLRKIRNLHG